MLLCDCGDLDALLIANLMLYFRYVFKNAKRVNLQELGPRFTLKLKWLQKGTFDRKGEHEWMFKPEMETSRRRFFL